MKHMLRGLIATLLCAVFAVLYTGTVQAQEIPESITLSPSSRKIQVNPGQKLEDTLTVINDGKTAYDVLVYSRPYSVEGENYEPNFTAMPTNADAYKWVQFTKTLYHLEPGATQIIPYAIQVPEKADAGGHYGVIFAETQPSGGVSETTVIRKKRVGMILYATVNGNFKTSGKTAGADIPFWQVEPPLKATVTATNDGNTDFEDDTQLIVKDIFGNTKYVGTKKYTVLPGKTRKMELVWENASWFGVYNVETQQRLLGQTSIKNGYVLIMPRYLPIVLGLMLVIGAAYGFYRRRSHK